MRVAKFFAALVGACVVLAVSFSAITEPAHGGKSKAYFATMKADLRNLVMAQEVYFEDSARFAPSLEALGTSTYQASSGVTVTLTTVSDSVWTATTRHAGLLDDATCTIEVRVSAADGTPLDAEPVCPQSPTSARNWRFIWER